MKIYSWTEESRAVFKGQTQEIGEDEKKEGSVEEKWQMIKDWVDRIAVKKEIKKVENGTEEVLG